MARSSVKAWSTDSELKWPQLRFLKESLLMARESMESWFKGMVITKDHLRIICDMAKAHTSGTMANFTTEIGDWAPEMGTGSGLHLMGVNTKVNGSWACSMGKESTSTLFQLTKEHSFIVWKTVMERKHLSMGTFTLGSTEEERQTARENTNGKTELTIREILWMDWDRASESGTKAPKTCTKGSSATIRNTVKGVSSTKTAVI